MLEIIWYLLFITLFGIILIIYNSIMKKVKIERVQRIKYLSYTIGITICWFSYIYLLINSGILLNLSLPPRFPLLIVLPLFIFTFVFLFIKMKNKILHTIPISIPIFYQSFRIIIEVLFYFTFLKGILPIEVTFEGYNYDILIGVTAIFMGIYAIKGINNEKILIVWNVIGILVVGFAAFIFISSFYFPLFWSKTEPLISSNFAKFPFILLPAFFMPSAIFMHLLSIIQLTRKLKIKTLQYF